MTQRRRLSALPPPATDLDGEQYSGRACVWCSKPLWRGAVSAGISRGKVGAIVLDNEVYACPNHANGPDTDQGQEGDSQ